MPNQAVRLSVLAQCSGSLVGEPSREVPPLTAALGPDELGSQELMSVQSSPT